MLYLRKNMNDLYSALAC